jgi:flagellar hook-associated protein 1 FlgK
MSGLSTLLETARRALMAQQVGIGVTGHNIANASTPGYSRQRVSLVPTQALREQYGFLGTGVISDQVTRLRDGFLDTQVWGGNAVMGDATARQEILSQIESSFNEPSSAGLSSAMSSFFNAFQDLSLHPEESSARNAVLQQGTLLSQGFHRLHDEITALSGSMTEDVDAKVTQINQLAAQISDLNAQITSTRSAGGAPNDLLDQRDQKIEQLSSLATISVSHDASGAAMVSIGGVAIAATGSAQTLRVQPGGSGLQVVTAKEGVAVSIGGGTLGGDLTLVNTTIPGYLSQLDELAGALIGRVNTVHRAGFGLGTPPPTGQDFFAGTGAADIGLSASVAGNPSVVAASSSGAPGDNSTALAISGIMNEPILQGNSLTLAQFYNGLVTGVGTAVQGANTTADNQQLILSQLDNQRQAVSGVSIDEEMTNLIKFQRGFDAAARLVNTTNEMFTTLITMVTG